MALFAIIALTGVVDYAAAAVSARCAAVHDNTPATSSTIAAVSSPVGRRRSQMKA
jgi:hypothetical protein